MLAVAVIAKLSIPKFTAMSQRLSQGTCHSLRRTVGCVDGPDGNQIVSCALLSKAAAPSIEHIHYRMLVVVPPGLYEDSLNPETSAIDV